MGRFMDFAAVEFFQWLVWGTLLIIFQKLIWVPLLNFLEVYVGIFFEFSPEVYMCIAPEFFKGFVGYVPLFLILFHYFLCMSKLFYYLCNIIMILKYNQGSKNF